MSMKENIDAVIAASIVNRAPFHNTFTSLKGLGLISYVVNTKTMEMTYKWANGEYVKTPSTATDHEIATSFSTKGVKDAIVAHNQANSSYYDFIDAIVKKGCASYKVDFVKNEVTYFGKNKTDSHTEKVPGFE